MVYILYRPNTEHERLVTEFYKRLEKEKIPAELVDVDTRGGSAKAEVYDITRYPAVLALRSDGSVVQSWIGELPMLSDVAFFARGMQP